MERLYVAGRGIVSSKGVLTLSRSWSYREYFAGNASFLSVPGFGTNRGTFGSYARLHHLDYL